MLITRQLLIVCILNLDKFNNKVEYNYLLVLVQYDYLNHYIRCNLQKDTLMLVHTYPIKIIYKKMSVIL